MFRSFTQQQRRPDNAPLLFDSLLEHEETIAIDTALWDEPEEPTEHLDIVIDDYAGLRLTVGEGGALASRLALTEADLHAIRSTVERLLSTKQPDGTYRASAITFNLTLLDLNEDGSARAALLTIADKYPRDDLEAYRLLLAAGLNRLFLWENTPLLEPRRPDGAPARWLARAQTLVTSPLLAVPLYVSKEPRLGATNLPGVLPRLLGGAHIPSDRFTPAVAAAYPLAAYHGATAGWLAQRGPSRGAEPLPASYPAQQDHSRCQKAAIFFLVRACIPPGALLPSAVLTLNDGIIRMSLEAMRLFPEQCCKSMTCPDALLLHRVGRDGLPLTIARPHGVGDCWYMTTTDDQHLSAPILAGMAAAAAGGMASLNAYLNHHFIPAWKLVRSTPGDPAIHGHERSRSSQMDKWNAFSSARDSAFKTAKKADAASIPVPLNAVRAPRGLYSQTKPAAADPAGAPIHPTSAAARYPKRTAADAVLSPQPARPQAGRGGGGGTYGGGSDTTATRRKGLTALYGSEAALNAAAVEVLNPPTASPAAPLEAVTGTESEGLLDEYDILT